MQARVATEQDRTRLDSFVAGSPFADVLQSYEWGEVKRAGGWMPVRILVEEDGAIAASCSVLLSHPVRAAPMIAYAPRGPVADYSRPEALSTLIGAVREKTAGAFIFICDPPVEAGSEAAEALEACGFRRASTGGFGGVQPKAVMVLDLGSDIETVFAGFKSKWRYNVRLAERKGVSVREGGEADLEPFYNLLVQTARRDGFYVRGFPYYRTLWERLTPPGMLKMLVAEYQGRPVAGIMLFCMGARVVYTYGASSNEDRNVMPNHLLQWHAIRWAKENGFEVYDFRGVSPLNAGEPAEPHLAGLNRFKEGFGARYVEYAGQFDLPLRKGWYALWRTAGPAAIAVRKKLRPPVDSGVRSFWRARVRPLGGCYPPGPRPPSLD